MERSCPVLETAPQPLYNGTGGTARENGANRTRRHGKGLSGTKSPFLPLPADAEYGFFDKGVQVFALEAFYRRRPFRGKILRRVACLFSIPQLTWKTRSDWRIGLVETRVP